MATAIKHKQSQKKSIGERVKGFFKRFVKKGDK